MEAPDGGGAEGEGTRDCREEEGGHGDEAAPGADAADATDAADAADAANAANAAALRAEAAFLFGPPCFPHTSSSVPLSTSHPSS